KKNMETETTLWFGDTLLRLDKIIAFQHNANTENTLKPSNIVYVTLDTKNGKTIEVEFYDFDQASDSCENLKQKLENYLYEQKKSK
ncbi:hypothetical protein M8845_19235, partial [Gelidibacter japonicus]|uniref:hypothetical protein n=1 Tax=Gelidibacter japonicus TaxID=1962232 RepID=UPI002020505D